MDYGSYAPVMAFVQVFKARGVPITIEEARGPMGVHKRDHIRAITETETVAQRWRKQHGRAPNEADVKAMFRDFIPWQVEVLADYADPIPGAVEAVAEFRARGLKIGSSTGYNRTMMDVLLPEAEARGYRPDCAVCVSDVPAGRPEPWMAFECAKQLRVYPMEAFVKVGDTLPDIAEALNAGMWAVGVAKTGNMLGLNQAEVEALAPDDLQARLEQAYERMYEAGAHHVVDALVDVPALLDEINARLARGEHPHGLAVYSM